MRLTRIPHAAIASCLFLIGTCVASTADEAVERGRELAERLCANCHLNPGQGEKVGASGIPGFKAVANRPSQTVEGIEAWLRSIPPMMPNHHLTREEISVLAAFVMSLRDRP